MITKHEKLAARRRMQRRRDISKALQLEPAEVALYRRMSVIQQKIMDDLIDHPFSGMVLEVSDDAQQDAQAS